MLSYVAMSQPLGFVSHLHSTLHSVAATSSQSRRRCVCGGEGRPGWMFPLLNKRVLLGNVIAVILTHTTLYHASYWHTEEYAEHCRASTDVSCVHFSLWVRRIQNEVWCGVDMADHSTLLLYKRIVFKLWWSSKMSFSSGESQPYSSPPSAYLTVALLPVGPWNSVVNGTTAFARKCDTHDNYCENLWIIN